MWEPQPLTTLRASKACRGENFTLPPLMKSLTVDFDYCREGFYLILTTEHNVGLALTVNRREAYVGTYLGDYIIISPILIYGKVNVSYLIIKCNNEEDYVPKIGSTFFFVFHNFVSKIHI
jgi:hypothetical protein